MLVGLYGKYFCDLESSYNKLFVFQMFVRQLDVQLDTVRDTTTLMIASAQTTDMGAIVETQYPNALEIVSSSVQNPDITGMNGWKRVLEPVHALV